MRVDTAALRRARELAGLTQTDLAPLAGISQNHLSAIERGKATPSPRVFLKIVRALDADPTEIRAADPDPEGAAA